MIKGISSKQYAQYTPVTCVSYTWINTTTGQSIPTPSMRTIQGLLEPTNKDDNIIINDLGIFHNAHKIFFCTDKMLKVGDYIIDSQHVSYKIIDKKTWDLDNIQCALIESPTL